MARDRARSARSLVCLLQALEGEHTLIELQNEDSVRGCIDTVDADMAVTMSEATFLPFVGRRQKFDTFYVVGKSIRYVHIPSHIDIGLALRNKLAEFQREALGTFASVHKRTNLKKTELPFVPRYLQLADSSDDDDIQLNPKVERQDALVAKEDGKDSSIHKDKQPDAISTKQEQQDNVPEKYALAGTAKPGGYQRSAGRLGDLERLRAIRKTSKQEQIPALEANKK